MPQDELWAASARLVGYTIGVSLTPDPYGDDLLKITPRFSKTPTPAHKGRVTVETGTDVRDYLPRLIEAAHHEMTGGLAVNVPTVVRARLQWIQEGFRQGSLH
jgi:hypothetical protein